MRRILTILILALALTVPMFATAASPGATPMPDGTISQNDDDDEDKKDDDDEDDEDTGDDGEEI